MNKDITKCKTCEEMINTKEHDCEFCEECCYEYQMSWQTVKREG